MFCYEVFIGISLLGVVALTGSFNLREIVNAQSDGWYIIPQFIGFVIFLIAGVAESHRLPFDIPEAEQEICAGYHTEYSGMLLTLNAVIREHSCHALQLLVLLLILFICVWSPCYV